MAALRRLSFIRNVLCNPVKNYYKNDKVMQIRTMTTDIQNFLENTFCHTDINILSTERKCKEFVNFYNGLNGGEKGLFLHILSDKFGVNQENVLKVAQSVVNSQDRGEAILLISEERLRNALLPRYNQIFRQISRIDGGVKFLVDMRADVINYQTTVTSEIAVAYYKALNSALRDLISLWFSVGFLTLQRVTWESPCDLVQKVSFYEAVHPIRNLSDMKQRVGPYRRCYVFNHNSMPREPVVVLHTALTQDIASSIHSIIQLPGFRPNGESGQEITSPSTPTDNVDLSVKEDINKFNTAIFYSITSTQKGLQSIDLGNYLIKKVVQELQKEFHHITQFSSLSPIPGFRDWLITEINQLIHIKNIGEASDATFLTPEEILSLKPYISKTSSVLETFKEIIQANLWVTRKDLEPIVKNILLRLCARYLYLEKRRQYALNPVANFHLGNGAVLWRINWMADMSIRGLTTSCGIMVNYRYYLESTETNSSKYLEEFHIQASQQVLDLCSQSQMTLVD